MRAHRFAAAALLTLVAAGCRLDPEDDRYARAFIAQFHARDSTAAALLEPESEISAAGWAAVSALAEHLPARMDSLRLTAWESIHNENGRSRKLTYLVFGGEEQAQAEVWIVTRDGTRYVNTVRTTDLDPAP